MGTMRLTGGTQRKLRRNPMLSSLSLQDVESVPDRRATTEIDMVGLN